LSGFAAIASPLPATIPAALVGAREYARRGEVDSDVARWSLVGGIPATIAGALLSRVVGGPALLIASGIVLGVVGLRVLWPVSAASVAAGTERRGRPVLITAIAAVVGLFTGLLANGGGFLLVPAYLLVLGLSMRNASGTSLVVVAALTIPTLATHCALGHVDWPAAIVFAIGAVPASWAVSRSSQRMRAEHLQRAFGVLLVAFSIWFVAYRLYIK
ncbi:MAG TPA: sulfite exporter TauE/SafE family protein, partial [Acidimicrobiia bacterium]